MKGPSIVVKGARAHNLKDIDIELPKNKLIVMTGLSGSENHHLHLTQYMLKDNVAM